MNQIEASSKSCLVCGLSCRTHFHFGGASCTACASFFRRTVSLNIRYVCKRENDCISSPELRSICRACRYECCINRAGMNRELVQQKKNDKRTPKYILNSRNTGVDEIVRDYMTNSYTTLHEIPELESKNKSPVATGFSKILDANHNDVLKFYVKQIEDLGEKNIKNTLLSKSIEELLGITSLHNDFIVESCTKCPGVDILERDDILILLNHFHFAITWLDSIWRCSKADNFSEFETGDSDLSKFINNLKSTICVGLRQLNLDSYEFAALQSFSFWKLGVHEFSLSMKIVAQEHYISVTSALRNHYKTTTVMEDFEIATRIAEITLQIGQVFNCYRDMLQFYRASRISITPLI